jgi:hypothetical protein
VRPTERGITIKEMTMTTNANNTNNSATSENRELTDDELNAASGGIIFVGRQPAVAETTIGSATGGAGAGKITFNPFSITRKND